jgi:hypothetical protein
MNNWIRVEDRIPEKKDSGYRSRAVLAYFSGYYSVVEFNYEADRWEFQMTRNPAYCIEYWAELPESPEESDE